MSHRFNLRGVRKSGFSVLLGVSCNKDKGRALPELRRLPRVAEFGRIHAMKNDCIFCAIAEGEIPSFKIFEDDMFVAYLDINPFSKGHTLVIPKSHAAGLLEADDAVLTELIVRVKKIAAHIKERLGCDGFNILQNNGEAAGQTVRHIHFHIVPRWNGDPLAFENSKGDMKALEALAAQLRM